MLKKRRGAGIATSKKISMCRSNMRETGFLIKSDIGEGILVRIV